MKPQIATLLASKGRTSRLERKFSLPFAFVFVQAVLHKEFVGAKSDKLLGTYTSLRPWFLIGSVRTGLPVAACMAFNTAGAVTQIVGSPTPPQKS